MNLTDAETIPAMANANRSATLSWFFAFRGSQIAQQNHIRVPVAINSIHKACGIVTNSIGFVTQNDEPDDWSKMVGGVTITNSP